ncbi:hypothetical protein PC116_g21819 [Phytophthora cactorum]|nr:hypothetical protein PC120_g18095 [Phytophthora cactorum]KAG3167168.1 hypothetical protein C6341_g11793 [Phytophthora cactorum]KAG3194703.1 hypothetical protein PC128_g9125 [Phytophthora cactorum]KAG4229879.1 hypothetical protein PC116_g21819 [Phytophthora cactorum]
MDTRKSAVFQLGVNGLTSLREEVLSKIGGDVRQWIQSDNGEVE